MQVESARSCKEWARNVFGSAQLGDRRRTDRLVLIAARAVLRPAGKVTEVVIDSAERQGAYDFLECQHVSSSQVIAAAANASFAAAKEHPFAFAAIDGTSLSLADHAGTKGFGALGPDVFGGNGLKVIDSLLVSPTGVPLGLASLQWWSRPVRERLTANQRRVRRLKLKVSEKESQHWIDAIAQTKQRADEAGVRLWFQLDREGDNQYYLWELAHCGHRFTVRSNWDRKVRGNGNKRQYLRNLVEQRVPIGTYKLDVCSGHKRSARCATMGIQVARVTLLMRDKWTSEKRNLTLTAVLTREIGRVPKGQKRLDWLLLSNAKVRTLADAKQVIYGYTQRWRIEDFHKTWKSGACNTESTQLRNSHAVMLWASILAVVATRIERLKLLSRTEPHLPASVELSKHEIQALLHLRHDNKSNRAELDLNDMPNIGQATLWIAELGGYTGKSSGGPPGSITIRRGLEYLRPAAHLLECLEKANR